MSSPPVIRLPLPGLLGDVRDAVIDELHRRLAAAGYPEIREAHGCVFRYLDERGRRISELAELSRMTKQAVGEHVDELVELGFVERVPDPSDGRAKIVRPTERGLAVVGVAKQAFADIEAEWGDAVGEQRVAEMRETLEALWALTHAGDTR